MGERIGIVGQSIIELGLMHAIHEDHVQTAGLPAGAIEHLADHSAILAGEQHVGGGATLAAGAAGGVLTVDQREAECGKAGGSDVDGPDGKIVGAHDDARPTEPQGRSRLAHVQRAMSAG